LSGLALSTMYFQRWVDRGDLGPFFSLGSQMEFTQFELSPVLSPDALAEVDPSEVSIAAVHHPCPRPRAFDPGDRLTAADPAARARAAELLGRTIETAARLGAPAVVLHLGRVEDTPDEMIRRLRFELESRYRAGQRAGGRYAAVLDRLKACLVERAPPHLQHALEALPPVLEMARRHGVRVGLETGYYADDLPGPLGMAELLDALGSEGLGAWLDTGHVGAQVNLGLERIEDWFGAVDGRWLGVHLHDVVALRDHLVPGLGELDFAAIGRNLPPTAIRSCEVDWYFTPEEVVRGVRHLTRTGCASTA